MSFKLSSRITDIIESQIPGFIRENYPGFVMFFKAYFEWLESKYNNKRGMFYGAKLLPVIADVDTTEDEFFKYFEKEFIPHIPKSALCDRTLLLKNIKQFYRTRGNEASYRLLFRILYLNEIGFYYPTVDILRPDEGKWVQDKSIRTKISPGDIPFDVESVFYGKRIIGLSSNAHAYVDHILKYVLPFTTIYELVFQKNSLYGLFVPFEKVVVDIGDIYSPYKLLVSPVLTNIKITSPGSGYSIGDKINISNIYNIKMLANISNVGDNGEVESVQVLEQGVNYPNTDPSNITIVFPSHLHTATGEPEFGAVFEYEGHYENTDGFLDNIEKLRDDYYYQEFSYQINSQVNLSEWIDIVKRLVHPAGCLPFNNYEIYPESILIGARNPLTEYKILYSYLNGTLVDSGLRKPTISDQIKYIVDSLTSDYLIPWYDAFTSIKVYVNYELKIENNDYIIIKVVENGILKTYVRFISIPENTLLLEDSTDLLLEDNTEIYLEEYGEEIPIIPTHLILGDIVVIKYEYDNSTEILITHDTNERRARIGPSLKSVNRDAYRNIPTQLFNDISSNEYWNNYANYSLEDMADISLYDLKYKEYKKI